MENRGRDRSSVRTRDSVRKQGPGQDQPQRQGPKPVMPMAAFSASVPRTWFPPFRSLRWRRVAAGPTVVKDMPAQGPIDRHCPLLVAAPDLDSAAGARPSQRRCEIHRRTRRQIGVCRVRPLFTGQNSQPSRRCEEGRHRATLGCAAGNRVSADAVGRRGHVPQGAVPSRSLGPGPLREMRRAGSRLSDPEGRGGITGSGTATASEISDSWQVQRPGPRQRAGVPRRAVTSLKKRAKKEKVPGTCI